MRDVQVVKDKRDEIQSSFFKLMELQRELGFRKDSWSEDEKRVFFFLSDITMRLMTQINALEFALNEDTYLRDAKTEFTGNKYVTLKGNKLVTDTGKEFYL